MTKKIEPLTFTYAGNNVRIETEGRDHFIFWLGQKMHLSSVRGALRIRVIETLAKAGRI